MVTTKTSPHRVAAAIDKLAALAAKVAAA